MNIPLSFFCPYLGIGANCANKSWLDQLFETTSVPQSFADDVGTSWFDLGLHLNIKRTLLSNIDDENKYNRDKVHGVISTWQKQQGQGATTRVLGNALLKIKRKDLADVLGESKCFATLRCLWCNVSCWVEKGRFMVWCIVWDTSKGRVV